MVWVENMFKIFAAGKLISAAPKPIQRALRRWAHCLATGSSNRSGYSMPYSLLQLLTAKLPRLFGVADVSLKYQRQTSSGIATGVRSAPTWIFVTDVADREDTNATSSRKFTPFSFFLLPIFHELVVKKKVGTGNNNLRVIINLLSIACKMISTNCQRWLLINSRIVKGLPKTKLRDGV